MSICEWVVNKVDETKVEEYSSVLNIPKLCASMFCARSFRETDEIRDFLHLHTSVDPFEFTDMKEAVECLNVSINNREKICVYGDYDADGITSTALAYSYLKSRNANVTYYIPNRDSEGYGLNCSAIQKLYEEGVNLILTVDNGVSAYEEVKLAVSLGMKVVITDHHKIPEKLPYADAIVNPCREEWDMKYRNFAGVGVVYKLIEAMEGSNEIKSSYLDLVAIGTIGDSIPLFGESRSLIKRALRSISCSEIKGIKLLFEALGIQNKSIDSVDLAFKLVPRINASGRMKDADIALKLLISEDGEECKKNCCLLEDLNTTRKNIEREIIEAVEKELEKHPYKKYGKIIIVKGENWHHGVLGIAAARIVQKYGKPCILISFSKNGEARGSCRSIEGFSIYDVVYSCSEYLERFGGHPMAAGINLRTENVDKFSDAVIESVKNLPIGFQKLPIDLELDMESLSLDSLKSIKYFEPFGSGNPEPIFLIKNMKLEKIQSIGQNKHLKLIFSKHGHTIETLYFNKKACGFLYTKGDILDIAVTLHENSYRSKSCLSIYIVDLRITDLDTLKVIKHKEIYEKFKRGEKLDSFEINILLPCREDFIKLYKYLISENRSFSRVDILSNKVFKTEEYCGKVYIILDVFENLKLVDIFWNGDEFSIKVNRAENKVDLDSSEALKVLNHMKESVSYE